MRIVPRTEIGLDPVVRSSSGTPRARMADARPGLTVHYTGVNVNYGSKDTAATIRAIEEYASGAGKPNEYNYVIDQADNGSVWEYAGRFRAAHSGGYNSSHYGVLMLNGTSEGLTDAQVNKFRWLRRLLEDAGAVRGTNEVVPHRAQRQTACPGDRIMLRFGELLVPYGGSLLPPPVEEGGDEMFVNYVRMDGTHPTYRQFANGTKSWIQDGDELSVYAFLQGKTEAQVRSEIKVMPNAAWMRATGVIIGPIPPGHDDWGVPL